MTPELIPHLPDLKCLIEEHLVGAVDREKIYQYSDARKNELYHRGNQYVFPILLDGNVADWSTTSGTMRYDKSSVPNRYDYVLNYIRGEGRKFVSVLGQRAPNVKCIADKLDDEDAVQRARSINDTLATLRAHWKVDKIQAMLTLSLWKTGTTFGRVATISDPARYGWVEEPVIELVTQTGVAQYRCMQCGAEEPPTSLACPQCGRPFAPEDLREPDPVQTPQQTDIKRYPGSGVELRLGSIFNYTCPFYGDPVEGIASIPWMWYEDEKHKALILSAFIDGNHPYAEQELRKIIDKDLLAASPSGLTAVGQLSRDTRSSPSGAFVSHRIDRWLFQEFWVTAGMYAIAKPELQPLLQQQFPSGMRVTFVQGEPIDAQNESLVETLSMCRPEPGESIFTDPICKDYMSVQDLINDMHNMVVETLERSNRVTFFDPQVLNMEALQKHASTPVEFMPAVPGVGKRLGDSMWTSPEIAVNPQIFQWTDSLIAKMREIVGLLPALFGGEGAAQTAYEASRKLNQALMQLSPVWNEMRSFWQDTYTNGIRQYQRFIEGTEPSMQGVHLEVEEAIPMTWGQIRDFFALLLDKGPDAWRMFGIQHPSNLETVHTALGLHGWTVPNLRERESILATIKQLLTEAPLQGPMGLQSSIPPDDVEHTPPLVVDVVREWAAGVEGQDAKMSKPDGYANVLAWARAYVQMMQPPMPGGPPLGGAPPGPPPGPLPGGQLAPPDGPPEPRAV